MFEIILINPIIKDNNIVIGNGNHVSQKKANAKTEN